MANDRRERGPQGIPGPPGPPGRRGPSGVPGKVGPRGPRGETGARGPKGLSGKRGTKGTIGKRGAVGPAGKEPVWRRELLAAVQNQISRIDHELDIQMKRMAQIQVDLDELRDRVKRLEQSPE
jgi:hypothetical protein